MIVSGIKSSNLQVFVCHEEAGDVCINKTRAGSLNSTIESCLDDKTLACLQRMHRAEFVNGISIATQSIKTKFYSNNEVSHQPLLSSVVLMSILYNAVSDVIVKERSKMIKKYLNIS